MHAVANYFPLHHNYYYNYLFFLEAQLIVEKKGSHLLMKKEMKVEYMHAPHPSSSSTTTPVVSPLSGSLCDSISSSSTAVQDFGMLPSSSITTGTTPYSHSLPINKPSTLSFHTSAVASSNHIENQVEETQPQSQARSELYYLDRLMIVDMPSNWNNEVLKMELEDTLNLDEGTYTLQSYSAGHLLVFSMPYNDQGMHGRIC